MMIKIYTISFKIQRFLRLWHCSETHQTRSLDIDFNIESETCLNYIV